MSDDLKALVKRVTDGGAWHIRPCADSQGDCTCGLPKLIRAVEDHVCTTDASWTVENEAKMSAIHERDAALAKAERLRQTVGKLRDALDPDGARSMLSMEAFLDGVPDPVASLRAENDRLRAVIQDNADSARTFLNDVLDAKHIGVVDRGDARDLRGICQVANRPENGGRIECSPPPTKPTCATCSDKKRVRTAPAKDGASFMVPCPDCNLEAAPPCVTCRGKGRVVTGMEAIHAPGVPMMMITVTAPCPSCAGHPKATR